MIVVALVLVLSSGSPKTAASGQGASSTPIQTNRASPSPLATPTVGDLSLNQLQVGDCLTGSNLNLNTNAPWPKLAQAVPCSQGHTAEVFYANKNFWPTSGSYPGYSTITKDAIAECDTRIPVLRRNRVFAIYIQLGRYRAGCLELVDWR